MRKRLIAIVALATLAATAAAAAPLSIAEVNAPAVWCNFASGCTLTANDSTAPITLPAASGTGFLQSRTSAPGEAGTAGAGLIPYQYRVDLRALGGITALPCITELALDFGSHRPLDYDGNGSTDDVFVVTGGGLGSVRPSSADKTGGRITFRFQRPVCAGNAPGRGESTFFFGLASPDPPRPVTAQAVVSLGGTLDLDARSPGGGDGAPPITADVCLPGLPFGPEVPVCRCLRDRTLRELRCSVLIPPFLLVRRTPLPLPTGEPFEVEWTLQPIEDAVGKVRVEDGLAPGFRAEQGAPPPLEFTAEGANWQGGTLSYGLATSRAEGVFSPTTVVTFEPGDGQGERRSSHFALPIGPAPWPDLSDAPSEPIRRPPADPEFGDDPCGRAAQRRWDQHVERFGGTVFGLSFAEYRETQKQAERCRRAMPDYTGICAGSYRAAFADCFLQGRSGCAQEAGMAAARCRVILVDTIPLPFPLPRPPFP